MPQWLIDWWNGLSERNRTTVLRAAAWLGVFLGVLVLVVLLSYIFLGTDWSSWGAWLQGWR